MLRIPKPQKRWLRIRDLIGDPAHGVPGRYPFGRTSLYHLMEAHGFPKPLYLSPGLPVWDEAALDAFEAARMAEPVVPSRGGYMPRKSKSAAA